MEKKKILTTYLKITIDYGGIQGQAGLGLWVSLVEGVPAVRDWNGSCFKHCYEGFLPSIEKLDEDIDP